MTCILKWIRLFLNWLASSDTAFSSTRASLFTIGILFISLKLSAQTPPLEVTIVVNQNISCYGGSDGIATVVANGGLPPYTYRWDNGQTSATATDLALSTHWVNVTDAEGTEELGIVHIQQPTPISANASSTETYCNQLTGTITVDASGGTGSYEYMLADHTEWQASNIFENLAPETYKTIIRDSAGCKFTLTGIEVRNQSGATIITYYNRPSTYGLPNGSIEIVAESPFMPLEYYLTGESAEWQWQSSPVFTGLAAGPYMTWVMDATGCKDSIAFEIQNEVEGKVNILAETENYCMNVPLELSVDGNNFVRIQSFSIELRFDPDILSFKSIMNLHPSLDSLITGGTFKVSLIGADILQIEFSIAPLSINITENQKLFTVNFDALSSGFSELEWLRFNCKIFESAGNEVPSLYVNGRATINPAPDIFATGSGVYCEDDELTLQAGPIDEGHFTWTSPTGDIQNGTELHLSPLGMNDNGQFRVKAVNEFCNEEKIVNVVVNPKPQISLGYNDTICFGQPKWLNPNPEVEYESYLWQNESTDQTILASEPDLYFVMVTDNKGCKATDSIVLIPCIINMLVPNAFTPGDDGINDKFKAIITSAWEPGKYLMQVFNRWGEQIFETNNFNEGWDGTYKGVQVSPGLYRYIIVFDISSYSNRLISSPIHGTVMVLR